MSINANEISLSLKIASNSEAINEVYLEWLCERVRKYLSGFSVREPVSIEKFSSEILSLPLTEDSRFKDYDIHDSTLEDWIWVFKSMSEVGDILIAKNDADEYFISLI